MAILKARNNVFGTAKTECTAEFKHTISRHLSTHFHFSSFFTWAVYANDITNTCAYIFVCVKMTERVGERESSKDSFRISVHENTKSNSHIEGSEGGAEIT